MAAFTYDLHVHSCLSPCADDDNTPNNIAGMGFLNGLKIMALTDHNTCGNCPAFMKAAERYGLVGVPGMELTTAEDIHLVCLFPTLEDALSFSEEISGKRRILVPNRKDIFGGQFYMDENDEIIGEEEYFLSNATNVTVDEAPALVRSFNGICYPAHIDRQANGIVAVLGVFPEEPYFSAFELHDLKNEASLKKEFPILNDKKAVTCSDAHYLQDLREENDSIELPVSPDASPEEIRKKLIETLSA